MLLRFSRLTLLRYCDDCRFNHKVRTRLEGDMMSDEAHQERVAHFRKGLTDDIRTHTNLARWDSGLYQFLVIGAAIAGFVSLAVGTLGDSAKWAGIIGALTSVATILSQQLNCVKAINWHQRMVVELDGILLQLLNESQLLPTEAELAEMSTELRAVRIKMAYEWERVTNQPPPNLGEVKMRKNP